MRARRKPNPARPATNTARQLDTNRSFCRASLSQSIEIVRHQRHRKSHRFFRLKKSNQFLQKNSPKMSHYSRLQLAKVCPITSMSRNSTQQCGNSRQSLPCAKSKGLFA
jgi:hypothetical protein